MPLFHRPSFPVLALALAGVSLPAFLWLVPGWAGWRWTDPTWDAPVATAASVPLSSSRGAVLPDSVSYRLFPQCSRTSPSPIGYWTPTASDIAGLERDLATYLETQESIRGQQPPQARAPLRNYYRQYAGVVVVGGKHLIYVNAISPAERELLFTASGDTAAWRNLPALVCDGGWALWGVEYDPTTHRFRGFAFNGEA